MNVNFEFGAEIEIIGIDFNGYIGYRGAKTHIIVDARRDGKSSTVRKVVGGLDSMLGNSEVSVAVINALEFIGINPESEIVLRAYFYYNGQDGASYSFEMSLEAPESDKNKFFEIKRIGIKAANFTPPALPPQSLSPQSLSPQSLSPIA